MKEDNQKNQIKKYEEPFFDPFGNIMKSMNDFFHERPVKRLLDTIDEFFQMPFPLPSIPIDMYETDKEFVITAELPGVKREQIHLECHGRQLMISINNNETIEEKNDQHQYYAKKHSFQRAARSITLPYNVSEKNIKAKYKDGLLEIRFPRQKTRKITIDHE
jgi:HSP20 family protein